MKKHLDIEIVNHIAQELGIGNMRTENLIIVYSQLLDRPSINRMEEWLSYAGMLDIRGIGGYEHIQTLCCP